MLYIQELEETLSIFNRYVKDKMTHIDIQEIKNRARCGGTHL
jgi:hypothetical protein